MQVPQTSRRWHPYKCIYAPYQMPPLGTTDTPLARAQHLYRRDRFTRSSRIHTPTLQSHPASHTPHWAEFSETDHINLIVSILEGPSDVIPRGANLALDSMVSKGYLANYFPLHEQQSKAYLKRKWLTFCYHPWKMPLTLIRNYYRESVALYTAFACELPQRLYLSQRQSLLTSHHTRVCLCSAIPAHYTQWLLAPALLGVATWVHQQVAGSLAVLSLPAFSLFVVVWATYVHATAAVDAVCCPIACLLLTCCGGLLCTPGPCLRPGQGSSTNMPRSGAPHVRLRQALKSPC